MFLKEILLLMTSISARIFFPSRNHKVVIREIFHSHVFLFKFCVVFRAISPLLRRHTPGEGPVHSCEGGRAWVPGEEMAFPHLPFTAGPPTQDLRLLPTFGPVVSSLPLVVEWATATLWSVMRALLLLQDVRRVWAQTHRIQCRSDLGKPSETIQARGLNLRTINVLVSPDNPLL